MDSSKEDNRRMALAFSKSTVESVDMEFLACPVCLDLPSGEVHQCLEGHTPGGAYIRNLESGSYSIP